MRATNNVIYLSFPIRDYIAVTACDKTWANIQIISGGRGVLYHVSVPDLVREQHQYCFGELSPAEFDRILAEHRETVLEIIKRLQ